MSSRGTELYREAKKITQKNQDKHSLRCDMINKFHVASEMANYSKFYFPHNLDFRGRAYPMPPHLNQVNIYQGNVPRA
jgi:DNA-directed RNA polymerase